jgi:N-acetylneuraminic acid mutarotase
LRHTVLLLFAAASCGGTTPAQQASAIASADTRLANNLKASPGTWTVAEGVLTSPGYRSAKSGPMYHVGAALPLRAGGEITIGIGQSSDYTLHLSPQNPGDSAVEDDNGRATYRGGFRSTDVIFVARDEYVEWFLLLRDPSAPSEFAWTVGLPKGLPRARIERDGAIAFCDASGVARLHMPPAVALDSRGSRREVSLKYQDGRLLVSMDTSGLAFPIVIDPAVESAFWTETAGPPSGRFGHAIVYDSDRDRTVLFGGSTTATLSDTWEYDGGPGLWTQIATTGSPHARSGHAMIYDPTRQKVLLFGGFEDDGTRLADTWEYDGTSSTWTPILTTGSPMGRSEHAMVLDSARNKVVMFGGEHNIALGDTWEYDAPTTTWSQVSATGTAPSPREFHAMAYDSIRSRTVLFAGGGSEFLNDTYEYDGANKQWTQTTPYSPSSGPSPGGYHTMIYDPSRQRVVVFGPQHGSLAPGTWEYDGTTSTWSFVATTGNPITRFAASTTYDSARGRTIMFGGESSDLLSETWEYDSTNAVWSLSGHPPGRTGFGIVYDSGRDVTILFGGISGSPLSDTWEYQGASGTWSQIATTGAPPARSLLAMAYDASRDRTLMFGGSDGNTFLTDTWEYEGTTATWTPIETTGTPAPYSPLMVYDSARSTVRLFGGASTFYDSAETWEYDAGTTTWSKVSTSGTPPAQQEASMVYDAAHDRMVLFGGFGATGLQSDTWQYDPTTTTWSQLSASPRPDARMGAAMAFHTGRGRTILFGGLTNASMMQDAWEFDGTGWTQLATVGAPPARAHDGMVYDSARASIVLFGGSNFGFFSDTWELNGFHSRGGTCSCPSPGPNCASGDCETGYCVDGVCCEGSSLAETNPPNCGSCQACNTAQAPGNCSVVVNQPDPDTCSGTKSCSSSGACAAASGQSCGSDFDCASLVCADATCCDLSCDLPCQTCDGRWSGTSAGTCATAPAGATSVNGLCGGYACDGSNIGCPAACSSDSGCTSGYYCNASGSCAPQKTQGNSCSYVNDCKAGSCRECGTPGNCVDGVCCESSCGGGVIDDCLACSVATGAPVNGMCAPIQNGQLCRLATGPCDTAASCDGVNPSCPPNAFKDSSTVCHAASGLCDSTINCSGSTPTCSPSPSPRGTICRAASGACDVSETCDGVTVDCPSDVFASIGTSCADALECKSASSCTGDGGVCPAQAPVPDGTSCANGAGLCTAGTCTLLDMALPTIRDMSTPTLDLSPRGDMPRQQPTDMALLDLAGFDAQGDLSNAAPDIEGTPTLAGGGCGCRIVGTGNPDGGRLLVIVLVALCVRRRRRAKAAHRSA